MYLFGIFRSFLPLRNSIGFGASDFLVLAVAILLAALILIKALVLPYARKLSHRTGLCLGLLFALAILLRVVLLPHNPVPIPSGADDFSYLLLSDTLAHFRLANTTHALPQFFESVFTLQQPNYASIYPPGQGMVLAFGQLILRSPWAGVLVASGALCALCYWMLRAWCAPFWALVGGLLAIAEFGPLNPWLNSYWGGTLSACAGCLVFGALPRLCAFPNVRNGALLGLGLALQILTRPFEAVFLSVAAAIYVAFALRGNLKSAAKPAMAGLGVLASALGLMLLQNKVVTDNWTTMPYMQSRYQYGVPTTFTFQPVPVPHRSLTPEQELDYRAQSAIHGPGSDSIAAFFLRGADRLRYLRFFMLPPLYLALLAFLPSLRRWRYLWAAGTILLFAVGTNFYPYFFPHYVAAVTCLFVLLSVRGLERMASSARLYVLLACGASFLFWFGIYVSGQPELLPVTDYQSWNYLNRGDPQGRAGVADQLAHAPGEQLVFVRYSAFHRFEEWIHNAADIDAAQTVWANDLGTSENEKLLDYFPRRHAWLLEPDARPPALTPYQRESGPFLSVH